MNRVWMNMSNPFPRNLDRFNSTTGRLEGGGPTLVQRLLVAEDASTRFEVTIYIQRIVNDARQQARYADANKTLPQFNKPFYASQTGPI